MQSFQSQSLYFGDKVQNMHKRARQVSSNLNDKYTGQDAIQVADHWWSFYLCLWSDDWLITGWDICDQSKSWQKIHLFLLVESFWKAFGKKVCNSHICITIAFPQFSNCRLKKKLMWRKSMSTTYVTRSQDHPLTMFENLWHGNISKWCGILHRNVIVTQYSNPWSGWVRESLPVRWVGEMCKEIR